MPAFCRLIKSYTKVCASQFPINFIDHTFPDDPAIRSALPLLYQADSNLLIIGIYIFRMGRANEITVLFP